MWNVAQLRGSEVTPSTGIIFLRYYCVMDHKRFIIEVSVQLNT